MDNMIYQSLTSYFTSLENIGYIPFSQVQKLLVLSFYRDFVFNDYRALLDKEDYHLIEQALDCIYGITCLIPYPDYYKMNKLHLGQMTEMAQRVKTLEDTPVVKLIHDTETTPDPNSDILIVATEGEGQLVIG